MVARYNNYIRGRYNSIREYFHYASAFARIHIFAYLTYICYFIWRLGTTHKKALPEDESKHKHDEISEEVFVSISSVIILFGMIIRLMDMIKFTETFSYIVKLVYDVVGDVKSYFSFLVLWIFIFALFY